MNLFLTVGELAFNSTITGLVEFLPVTLSFIAAKGCVSPGAVVLSPSPSPSPSLVL